MREFLPILLVKLHNKTFKKSNSNKFKKLSLKMKQIKKIPEKISLEKSKYNKILINKKIKNKNTNKKKLEMKLMYNYLNPGFLSIFQYNKFLRSLLKLFMLLNLNNLLFNIKISILNNKLFKWYHPNKIYRILFNILNSNLIPWFNLNNILFSSLFNNHSIQKF